MIEVDYARAEAYASEYVDARDFKTQERSRIWSGVRAGYLKALEDARTSDDSHDTNPAEVTQDMPQAVVSHADDIHATCDRLDDPKCSTCFPDLADDACEHNWPQPFCKPCKDALRTLDSQSDDERTIPWQTCSVKTCGEEFVAVNSPNGLCPGCRDKAQDDVLEKLQEVYAQQVRARK